MIMSFWLRSDPDSDVDEWTGSPGTDYPKHEKPGMTCMVVIEGETYEEVMTKYHEWQGWEPYKPFPQ